MQFSTVTIALAAASLFNLGTAAALPFEAEVAVSGSEIANEPRSLTKRARYTHCACQVGGHTGIDSDATARVVGFNKDRWELDIVETPRFKYGAHFTGFY
ncbi:hypothetical protein PtrEW7m1_010781, partial [Pyrenophora tritici-repentis]